jgi:ribonucleoside-diphosphate reductase alpha chain
MIALFSYDDEDMLTCKYGNWWETNSQRGRANNSVVLVRHKIKEEDFKALWKKIELSRSGEPGIFFTNDKQWLTNPCGEISLHPNQFCNLTTINVGNIIDQEDFNNRCRISAFFATLQAGFTNFHFLRDIWNEQTEKEALIGVSMTGVASGHFLSNINLTEGAYIVLEENERVAKLIGINKATRCTTLKPEGTSSLICGTSSGIHAWHAPYYIRRIRVGKNEAIYTYFKLNCPDFLEDDLMNSNQAILKFPIKAPEGSIFRDESPLDLLNRTKKIHDEWIVPGHRKGSNYHNVSVTVSIKDNEWEAVGNWMWENRDSYNGISVLPYDGGTYVQAPFEECTKEQYEELYSKLHSIDLSYVYEEDDTTDLKGEIACSGGGCEIK